jgi:hypothetical protein
MLGGYVGWWGYVLRYVLRYVLYICAYMLSIYIVIALMGQAYAL